MRLILLMVTAALTMGLALFNVPEALFGVPLFFVILIGPLRLARLTIGMVTVFRFLFG